MPIFLVKSKEAREIELPSFSRGDRVRTFFNLAKSIDFAIIFQYWSIFGQFTAYFPGAARYFGGASRYSSLSGALS